MQNNQESSTLSGGGSSNGNYYRYVEKEQENDGSFENYSLQDCHPITEDSLRLKDEFLLKSGDGDFFFVPVGIVYYSKYLRGLSKPSILMQTHLAQAFTDILFHEQPRSKSQVEQQSPEWYSWGTSQFISLDFISTPVLHVIIQYMFYRQKYFSQYETLCAEDPAAAEVVKATDLEMHAVIPEFKIDPTLTVDVLLAADFLEI